VKVRCLIFLSAFFILFGNIGFSFGAKTGGCDGCEDAGAISSQQIASGDGYVEFTASETITARAIGLSHGNPGITRNEIDYAVMLWGVSGGIVEVYENGVWKAGAGSFATGDVFRISVVSGVVKCSKNGTVFYTSTTAPSYPLLVDTSFWSGGSTITNAVISSAQLVN
jgi:hypothetical protein